MVMCEVVKVREGEEDVKKFEMCGMWRSKDCGCNM